MKKILLIEPPFYRLYKDSYSLNGFPLALAYLSGSILENTKWSVKAYNADFRKTSTRKSVSFLANKGYKKYLENLKDLKAQIWIDIKNTISEYNPAVIGISAVSSNYISACNVALIAKEFNKNIKVVLGGPYPTMARKAILENPNIDYSVIGEGEITIVELLKYFEGNNKIENIEGLVFRKNGKIKESKPRQLMNNLDHLPFPIEIAPKVLIDFKNYPIDAFKNILATRGCPYDCLFCASKELWTKKVRTRSASNVKEEIEQLMRIGIKRFQFIDDTFGAKKKYFAELCNQMKIYCKGIRWTCLTRADLITNELLISMKESGCEIIQIGVESGNDIILKSMKKNITVEEILKACKLIKQHKIELQTFFLVGFPHETEKTLQDTVDMMKKCKSDSVIYSIFTPYPHTELYDYCEEHGLINKNIDPTLFNHQSPENCFSLHIQPERFRKLASKIERMVEFKNNLKRIKSIFFGNGLMKIIDIVSIKFKN